MAEGVARCWCMLCMQLRGTGTKRLSQASTCLKEKALGFSSPSPGKAALGQGVPGHTTKAIS